VQIGFGVGSRPLLASSLLAPLLFRLARRLLLGPLLVHFNLSMALWPINRFDIPSPNERRTR
jgi:hypothetical protein